MNNFADLGVLYNQIKSIIASKEYQELELPDAFKAQLSSISDRTIKYFKYTAVAYKTNADSIIIPNYWFYLAKDILPFNIELHRYYNHVVNMNYFTPNRLNELKNSNLSEEEKRKVELSCESTQDADYICKFLTNYNWWHGGKELGRGQKDYYVSAVLSISSLINDSSSYLAAICEVIRENQSLSNLLVEFEEKKGEKHINYNEPLQQIFYGAPGTGKSNTIRKVVDEGGKKNYRTTFHPDSDYSTFVGAYKPSMKPADISIYSAEELAVKLKEIKNTGVSYPCHKFAAKYWRSLKDLSAEVIKQILSACGFTESMNVEISKGVAIGQEYLNKDNDGKIIYTFTPQAFTRAYVEAWNTEEEVYLIIEEINRGNCAQIFGDLFQLLDRDENGFSEYPIDADTDLGNYIKEALKDSPRSDFRDGVKEGKKLVLPNNLFIWATMNTSDQSLFPIDSAFKRRWDWKYIPINEKEKTWYIEIEKGNRYSWSSFLKLINDKIGKEISSEDKKLGFFFCKATVKDKDGDEEPTIITVDTFVSKVLFYIYNDVFKDYGLENYDFFKYKDSEEVINFHDYFKSADEYNLDNVNRFLNNLNVERVTQSNEENDNGNAGGKLKVAFPDGTIYDGITSVDVFMNTISKVVNEVGIQAVKDADVKLSGINIIQDRGWKDSRYPSSAQKEMDGYVLFTHADNEGKRAALEKINKALNLELRIEIV